MKNFSLELLKLLKEDFKDLNLTKILDEDEFFKKQILDSLLPLEHLNCFEQTLKKTNLMLDVGFGGGFPLLPMAKKNPESYFFGIEARQKKVNAVLYICKQLGLNNVGVKHFRLEELLIDRECLLTLKPWERLKICF